MRESELRVNEELPYSGEGKAWLERNTVVKEEKHSLKQKWAIETNSLP